VQEAAEDVDAEVTKKPRKFFERAKDSQQRNAARIPDAQAQLDRFRSEAQALYGKPEELTMVWLAARIPSRVLRSHFFSKLPRRKRPPGELGAGFQAATPGFLKSLF
jgi:hypothetical protein